MKNSYTLKLLGGCLILLFTFNLKAQDIHYSQFNNSHVNLNPGLTGVFNGDIRFASNFKPQWNSVPVSYLQFTTGLDARFFNKDKNGPLAAGFFLDYDQAGDSRLTFAQFSFTGSYSFRFDKAMRNYLTLGVTGSAVQRSFNTYQLFFDENFEHGEFCPQCPVTDPIARTKVVFGDINVGLNLHLTAPFDRSSLDVGFAVFHLNEPTKSFFDMAAVRLERRYSAYAMGNKVVNSHMDATFFAMGQLQGPHKEILFGSGVRHFLVSRPTRVAAIDAGVYYRLNDAIIPYMGFHYNGWKITVSYDANLSQFREATLGFGGVEVSAIYIITEVPFKSYCPHCPAFL